VGEEEEGVEGEEEEEEEEGVEGGDEEEEGEGPESVVSMERGGGGSRLLRVRTEEGWRGETKGDFDLLFGV
jgi:hypothetical protein